jgi:hypothetical protein
MRYRSLYIFAGVFFLFCHSLLAEGSGFTLVWPTPSTAFAEGHKPAIWVQPTESGTVKSALFGCVRNGGSRFHEGIDIRPVLKRKHGEATDPIYSIMDGQVAYINKIAGNSSYGRYVVVVHTQASPQVYSLYAHLSSVDAKLRVGQYVRAGAKLGIMGRSALYHIPKTRAHLHLEIGVRLTNKFENWYSRQNFKEKNFHGLFNGMNLTGFNPLDFYEQYRRGNVGSILDYVNAIPTGYVLRIAYPDVPDYVKRYPELVTGEIPENGLVGWEVSFTWFGLPKRWQAITEDQDMSLNTPGTIRMVSWNPKEFEGNLGKKTIVKRNGQPTLGKAGIQILQILFDFK